MPELLMSERLQKQPAENSSLEGETMMQDREKNNYFIIIYSFFPK